MRKFHFSFLACLISGSLYISDANAQAGPQLVQLTPPSPSSAAFQKYGDIPISAYTGVPDISIPIYTIKYKDITIPISVSYHASGIKVAEEASPVGLGWTLNAGGIISRNILGGDDFTGTNYYTNTVPDLVNGKGPTFSTVKGCNLPLFNMNSTPTTFNFDITPYVAGSPITDFQPDQYYYSYPGHSGKFVMTRDWTAPAIVQKQESILIKCLASDGSSWQIKSAEGYIYDYTLSETYNDAGVHKSAWYLTKITSPLGNIVTFSYTTVTSAVQPVGSYTEAREDFAFTTPTGLPYSTSPWQRGAASGKLYTSKVLTGIQFTNGQVNFNYSFNTRLDLLNDGRLDNITITAQGAAQPFKTFTFAYDYFVGNVDASYNTGSSTDNLYKRLKLTQITESGNYNGQSIQNPPYMFTYNEPVGMPAKTSFARDHWGYYNGITGRGTLIPDQILVNSSNMIVHSLGLTGLQRESNSYYAPVFSLASIKYPAGGWTEFQFESNDFDEAASQVNDHSYFALMSTMTPVQKSIQMIYNATTHQYTTGTTINLTNIYIDGGLPVPVSLSSYFRFDGNNGNCPTITGGNTQLIYFELVNSSGVAIAGTQVDPFAVPVCNGSNSPCMGCPLGAGPIMTYNTTYQLSPGVYTWRATVGSTNAALHLMDIGATYSWYEMASTGAAQTNNIITGGGLRIKRIIDHDGINEANNKVRRYVYHYFADKTSSGNLAEYSYGRRMSKPEYAYFTVGSDNNNQPVSGGCLPQEYFSLHLIRTGDSFNPLNGSAAGTAVGYDQVTELLGENGEFGKKVYQYYNQPDIVNSFSELFSGQSLPMRSPYGSNIINALNGSLADETDYTNLNGNFYKAKEIINIYSTVTTNNQEVIDYAVENRTSAYAQHSVPCTSTPTSICDDRSMTLAWRTMQSDWSVLANTKERLYNQNGDELHFAETSTDFYYENTAHLQLTKSITTNSKGEQIINYSKYPLDYTTSGATDAFTQGIQNLVNKHVVSVPIEKYIQKKKADGTNIGVISAVLTSYNNSLPSPALAYASMLSAPSTSFAASSIITSGLLKDATYQSLISFDAYDASGNITQQHKINDMNHGYIWDYNNSLLIAETSNAAANEIAYTSFEADGLGNWTLTDPTRTSAGMTGLKSYTITLGQTISKSALTSGKNYIVSYWSKNGPVNVNGVAATTGISKNQWTYYEHLLPTTTTSVSITNPTSANIDELRLYPSTALMTTYTYVPTIGVSSICSPNNTILYYIYDGMGRLQQIMDMDWGIIKTIDYHLQNQVP